jgi:hypothetical protein
MPSKNSAPCIGYVDHPFKKGGLGLLDHAYPLTRNLKEGQGNRFFWLDGERKTLSGKHTADVLAAVLSETIWMQGEQSPFGGFWQHDGTLAHSDSLLKGWRTGLPFKPPFGSHGAVRTRSERQAPWFLLVEWHARIQSGRGSAAGSLDAVVPGCAYATEAWSRRLVLLLLKKQQLIEACLPHTPQETFADGIGSGRMKWCLQNLNGTGSRHVSKARPACAVVLPNEIPGCLPIRSGFSQRYAPPRDRTENVSRPHGSPFESSVR